MEDTKKRFFEIWGNIKHDFTGIIDERGVDNYNYRLDQIIEATKSSSWKMGSLLQRVTLVIIVSNSNNNYDSGVNETHDYHDAV